MSNLNYYKSPWEKGSKNFRDTPNTKGMPQFDFGQFFDGNTKKIIAIILSIAAFVWLASGFYIVQEGQQAAVMRFGKFVRVARAGPNYHIPYPIENIIKVSVDRIQREEIGFRSATGIRTSGKNNLDRGIAEESLMLTGDENIADINFFVQWRVSNIADYLFNVENAQETVKSSAESAMREVIGNSTITEAQTEGRAKVEQDTKLLLQKILNSYKAGITVENLHLLKVDPPAEVIDAFRDVQTARADKERLINQAEAYRNDILPKARGEAAKILQEAEGHKKNIISLAKGEAEKFKEIYAEYAKAKDITKKRMYIETMEKIYSGMHKIILTGNIGKSAVPYLPLNELKKDQK